MNSFLVNLGTAKNWIPHTLMMRPIGLEGLGGGGKGNFIWHAKTPRFLAVPPKPMPLIVMVESLIFLNREQSVGATQKATTELVPCDQLNKQRHVPLLPTFPFK